MGVLDYFSQDLGDVLIVIGTVDASDIEISGTIWLPLPIYSKPVRMGLVEVLVSAV
jgi:hypothetical protein